MKNNINKEEWIDQVLESTRDMTEAKLPHDLYEQITNKLSAPTKPKTVPNTVDSCRNHITGYKCWLSDLLCQGKQKNRSSCIFKPDCIGN